MVSTPQDWMQALEARIVKSAALRRPNIKDGAGPCRIEQRVRKLHENNRGNTIRLKRRSGQFALVTVRLVTLIGVAAAGLAQDGADARPKSQAREGPQHKPGGVIRLRRLESVTWDPVADELTWVVSAGTRSGGVYQPGTTETYLIHPESATMRYKDEARRFSQLE